MEIKQTNSSVDLAFHLQSKVKKGVGTSSLASNMSTHNASATQTGYLTSCLCI